MKIANLLCDRNVYIVFLTDAALVAGSLYLSYLIRFEFQIPLKDLNAMVHILPFALSIKMITFIFCRMYQEIWRYTGLFDLLNIIKATLISSTSVILMVLALYRFEGYPRSVFLIDWGLTLILVGGFRTSIRLFSVLEGGIRLFHAFSRERFEGKKLLIIGAGGTGEKVLRELLDTPSLKLIPVGFLDDEPAKQGKTIHGVKVLGSIAQIESFRALFDEILITFPSASGQQMRNIVAACEKTGKRFRTIASLGEVIDRETSIRAVRDVTVQDLLGREEVNLSKDHISTYLHKKRILITGAGGSIGSELVRQVIRFYPSTLALVEMNELNLFRVEKECHHCFGCMETTGFLTDIRNSEAMGHIFRRFQPQVVFHAAAYKHVPLQELHPWEAVRNNVLGTRNLVRVSQIYDVERFVLVSTDKAVRPTSVMGATKRVAEQLIICGNNNSSTRFVAVRFGNVLGSSGSVIPLFQEQIARGGPVTVTHPEITRYFMSIPEAAQLILEAGAMGKGGEIFLLDMGKPMRIIDLARDLIRLYGYELYRDIPIHYVGLRPGEKLHEELITKGEGIVNTKHEKIMVLRGEAFDANILQSQVDALLEITHTYNVGKIKQQLREIVPEYTPEPGIGSAETITHLIQGD